MNGDQKNREHPLLMLADDDAEDRALIEQALKECAPEVVFASVASGGELLAYLAPEAGHRTPDLILLDMMMPDLSGFEVLAERKRLPALLRVPFIAMTIAGDEDAVRRAYDLGASAYLTKPYEYKKLVRSMAALVGFYFSTAQLPGRKQPRANL